METMEPLTEAAVRSAIMSVAGNLTWAAQLLDTTREELLDYVARRPPLRELMEDIRQGLVDDAQALLRKATVEQQPWAIRVVLRTQGRRRGFGNRVEPLEPWKPPPEPEPIWDRLPEEEQARLVELYAAIVERNKELDAAADASVDSCSRIRQNSGASETSQAPNSGEFGYKEPSPTKPPTEEVVRPALVKHKGHLTNAAAELGMTRSALELQIERRQILRALMINFREELIDHAESGLRLALGKGAQWAIQLVLETIGGKHGYGKAYLPAEDLDWLEPPSKYDLSVMTDAEIDEIVHLHNIAQGIEEPTVISAAP
jgi:hypothetical protein